MKRRLSIWLALCLLCLYGAALGEETVVEFAASHGMSTGDLTDVFTEIYCYTPEEADRFLCSVTETDDTLEYVLYLPEHPDWRYTHVVNCKTGGRESSTSPFRCDGQPSNEGGLRLILREAEENGWFENWDEAAMANLLGRMTQLQMERSPRLEAGLAQKNLTAAEAVQEMFVSTFGDELTLDGTRPGMAGRGADAARVDPGNDQHRASSGRSALAGGGTRHRQDDGRGVRRPTAGRTSKPLCK